MVTDPVRKAVVYARVTPYLRAASHECRELPSDDEEQHRAAKNRAVRRRGEFGRAMQGVGRQRLCRLAAGMNGELAKAA
jgi:hypothetical protein